MTAEVIVVGAGPAGSAMALLLARSGRDVLLVDQARFPRDKPCGEYLNPAAMAVLRRLGVEQSARDAGAREVIGVCLRSPAGREVKVPYPAPAGAPPPHGLSVPRMALDAALLQAARAAGVTVREGFRVDDLLRWGGRVVGIQGRAGNREQEVRARLVVAADGSRSLVARRLDLARKRPAQRFGLVAHYEGVEGSDWVEMHAGRRGYCGLGYSAGGGANVAMVADPADLPQLQGRAEAFFVERLSSFPVIARRLAAGRRVGRVLVTGSMSSSAAAAGAPGVLLVGDAAGFFDPFTGEGLSYALRGAELAAEAVKAMLNHRDTEDTEGRETDGLKKDDPGPVLPLTMTVSRSLCPLCLCGSTYDSLAEAAALRAYAARRRAEFAPRVLVSRVIQAVLRRPGVLEGGFHRFEADPTLAARLIGVTAGILPPAVVLNPWYVTHLLLPAVPASATHLRRRRPDSTPERLNA